ncbi:MarR family winged helix-turn-helix transcriptional regulator [Nonomuraea cavernae]|uniref:Transcriptional regulator n=1 Tax=Nonomuraea cavernae TaxID=2045107 RepID=A0A917YPF8_9ACTN|nr:MarR family transcriptional regulator [Nonomuraea cavernae]MCA2183714.1 MarR family transcriptional regulator [Nonomuraea cavernae]GGO61141.1 transcriptional regulator [Nonomuraea cavernae]
MTARIPDATELMFAIRRLNVENDRFAERFADLHGLHRTDLNALVVILDAYAAGHPLTPGHLGAALNLSPPATTALINRLEGVGHVERRRSATDRRKVEVVLNEQAARLAGQFFTPLARQLATVIDEFAPEEREVIGRFLDRAVEATAKARRQSTA